VGSGRQALHIHRGKEWAVSRKTEKGKRWHDGKKGGPSEVMQSATRTLLENKNRKHYPSRETEPRLQKTQNASELAGAWESRWASSGQGERWSRG